MIPCYCPECRYQYQSSTGQGLGSNLRVTHGIPMATPGASLCLCSLVSYLWRGFGTYMYTLGNPLADAVRSLGRGKVGQTPQKE